MHLKIFGHQILIINFLYTKVKVNQIFESSLDTIGYSITCDILHFRLFINRFSHQILQTSCSEYKKRD